MDLSSSCSGPQTPLRITPIPFGGSDDYVRMLKEAQKESGSYRTCSAKVSPISSALMSLNSTNRNTPMSTSPKSPPNSPNTELASFVEDFKGVYINDLSRNQPVTASELIWDWNSRPTINNKEFQLRCRKYSQRSTGEVFLLKDDKENVGVQKSQDDHTGLVSRRNFIYSLIITNIFSLLVGTGVG